MAPASVAGWADATKAPLDDHWRGDMGGFGGKLRIVLAAATIGACSAPAAALAGAPADVRGTWTGYACLNTGLAECEAHPTFPQTYVIETENFETGAITGSDSGGSNKYKISGTVTGCTVHFRDYEFTETPTYESEGTQVLNAEGTKLQGTFTDNGFGAEKRGGAAFSTRASGPGCKEGAAKEEKGLRPTATSVICNYEFATSEDTCGASVGDGGAGTPVTPTGTVKFTGTSGGFPGTATCTLSATPLSPQVGYCQIVYFTSYSGLPTITATYSGDSQHASSVGHTTFLGANPGESALEAPAGPAGSYPNELQLETTIPVEGTTVNATVESQLPTPVPVPISVPKVPKMKDTQFAADDELAIAFMVQADAEGEQNPKTLTGLDKALEKVGSRVNENAGKLEKAEVEKQIKAMSETTEAVTRMERLRQEYMKDAIEGTHAAGAAEKKIENLDMRAEAQLELSKPSEQLAGAKRAEEATRRLEELNRALQVKQGTLEKILGNLKALRLGAGRLLGGSPDPGSSPLTALAARRSLGRIRYLRSRPLSQRTARNLKAGKQKLSLPLNKRAVKKLAGHRSSVTVLVRVEEILPSKLVPGGVPRIVLQSTTLKRAAKH